MAIVGFEKIQKLLEEYQPVEEEKQNYIRDAVYSYSINADIPSPRHYFYGDREWQPPRNITHVYESLSGQELHGTHEHSVRITPWIPLNQSIKKENSNDSE